MQLGEHEPSQIIRLGYYIYTFWTYVLMMATMIITTVMLLMFTTIITVVMMIMNLKTTIMAYDDHNRCGQTGPIMDQLYLQL